jgi:hypothetical protein
VAYADWALASIALAETRYLKDLVGGEQGIADCAEQVGRLRFVQLVAVRVDIMGHDRPDLHASAHVQA